MGLVREHACLDAGDLLATNTNEPESPALVDYRIGVGNLGLPPRDI